MQRHAFADQRMKRLVKLGWFHGFTLVEIDLVCKGKS
jgi:hypothetical protein